MSYVKTFTVGDAVYNAVMASAFDQDRLMSLLSAALIERAVAMARQDKEIGDDVLVPMFMAMPHDRKAQVAGILMHNVKLNGSNTNVDLKEFHGKIVQYNQLLAQLLKWNLGDFFDYLASVVSAEAKPEQSQAPQ